MMLGTHDTATIWQLADTWCSSEIGFDWGQYLAGLLDPSPGNEARAVANSRDPGTLVNACFMAMLRSRARNISVFFADLFGMTGRYNRPGVVSDQNWSLRVPNDFEEHYERQLKQGRALDVAKCLLEARREVHSK
jgi:hypothetical protein